MSDPIQAWQCIGCGRIEAPQNCIGICQDRRVLLVYAHEQQATELDLAAARRERDTLFALVRQLAYSRPRDGEWERSYAALQGQARTMLNALQSGTVTSGADAVA